MICRECHRELPAGTAFCPHDGGEPTDEPRIALIASERCRQTGSVVADRYRIHGRIGRGAMGAVYLAEDLTCGEPVALKTLGERGSKAEERMRLLNSVIAAAEIDHPNVARIEDIGRVGDTPYVVMEHLWGESLADRLERDERVPLDEALAIARDVCAGLAAAHAGGVVHRDVKPGNIFLLGVRGLSHGAKVIDFGLAKSSIPLTGLGVAVGTVRYMAPEQALADEVGPEADIYGVGMVMYRMITGRHPFPHSDTLEVMARQLLETPPSIFRGENPILRNVSMLVAATLRKAPENRYPSMARLRDDLQALIDAPEKKLLVPGLRVTPDGYRPKRDFAVSAAKMFYQKMGLALPPWLSG